MDKIDSLEIIAEQLKELNKNIKDLTAQLCRSNNLKWELKR